MCVLQKRLSENTVELEYLEEQEEPSRKLISKIKKKIDSIRKQLERL